MPLQSNIDKAQFLRSFIVKIGAGTSPKRVLRTKVTIKLKGTKFPSEVVNYWCIPMHRPVTADDLENFRNILGHIERSSKQDLADVEWMFAAMVM
ncbi:hypothetical protein [Pseudomonas yamanorum]|jgi:hypothetical protein|uniref:hypothetical protein n=1 Tax=Pseudomonas yamanorum TaxID=515393 RepID=UPI003B9E7BCA